jgi:signal transduction histidine kinase
MVSSCHAEGHFCSNIMGISLKPFGRIATRAADLPPQCVPDPDRSRESLHHGDRYVSPDERKFLGLIELVPHMIWVVTSQGCGENFNRHWISYTGIPEGQSVDFGWTQAFHPDDLDRFISRLHKPVLPGWEIEVRLKRALDGTYRRQLAHCSVVESEAEGLSKLLVSCTDVEDWRQSETDASERGVALGLSVRSSDEERRKIAHGLHDSAGQYLVALQMKLDSLQRCSIGNTGRKNPVVDECRNLVTRCSREIRAISHLLHPPLLDDLGLDSAVRFHVDGFIERTKFGIELEIQPNLGRLDRDLELALFCVIREALANIRRRSSSQTARIKIGASPTTVFAEIATSDGGMELFPGKSLFSPHTPSGARIAIVRQRIQEAGGVFEVIATPGELVVRAAVPRRAVIAQACD